MKKVFLMILAVLATFGTMHAQRTVCVYFNDSTQLSVYESVIRLSCSKYDADSVLQESFVIQDIETADSLVRIPIEDIKCIGFQATEPIPASFPRKHLIEEFTGQACGYCPYGMDCISEFMENDTNFILILHHYGYQADHFSVSGSKTITSALGVSGAPSVAIDRKKTKTSETNTIVFHPAYLPEETDKAQFDTMTYASVNITNTYDSETRELQVTVSGAICREDHPALNITVLVKESGMIDTQSDYYNTFEGWKEFRHCNAVRAFLTAPKGDVLNVDLTNHYSVTYTTTLKEAWVPENCMVVAFLGESFKPVIQVEDEPVVAGTAGGDDIEHGGITPVPVPDYYPEPDSLKGPADYSKIDVQTMTTSECWYDQIDSLNAWTLQTYNSTVTCTVLGTKSVPFAYIYFYTKKSVTALPVGTYMLNTSGEAGTAAAGYRDDELMQLGGSEFYFVSYSYLSQGYLVPTAEWLIVDGTFTIEKESWSLEGHARNGSTIQLKGGKITNYGRNSAPKQAPMRQLGTKGHFEQCK